MNQTTNRSRILTVVATGIIALVASIVSGPAAVATPTAIGMQAAGTWAVDGSVQQRSTAGVAGATVTATSWTDASVTYQTVTDALGKYRLWLPNGGWYLTTPNGNWTQQVSAYVDSNPQTAPDLVLLDAPTPPVNIRASVTGTSVRVRWDAPGDDGGTGVTAYTVTSSASSPPSSGCTATGSETTCLVGGLTTNRDYAFTVRAENAVGLSARSTDSNTVTVLDPPPSPPLNVTAVRGDQQATVSWTAAWDATTVTTYTVRSEPGGRTCQTSGSQRTCQVTGLTNGQAYRFTVVATSTGGDSTPSTSGWVTPVGAPTSPRDLAVTAGNAQVTATWSAPASNGGSPLSGYVATASPGGQQCATPATGLSCTITGLTNGTSYTVSVTAANNAGLTSPAASSKPVIPSATDPVPTPEPQALKVRVKHTNLKGKVRVQWVVTGARQVTLRWVNLSSGTSSQKPVRPTGTKVLKGSSGARFKVRVTAITADGTRAAKSRTVKVTG